MQLNYDVKGSRFEFVNGAPKKPGITKTNMGVFIEHIKRGEDEFFAQVVCVTPEIASFLLERNVENRQIRWKANVRSVQSYAEAMTRGEWELNGQTIIVSRDGFLNDGQHRLWAVIEANVAVDMLVTFGAERQTRSTVDKGSAKTPGDTLKQNGEINCNVLAHALQFVWAKENNKGFTYRPSPQQLLYTLECHPNLRVAVEEAAPIKNQKVSAGYIVAAHYYCKQVDERVANEFLRGVLTGVGIMSVDSPVGRLRERYARHASGQVAHKLPALYLAALYVKSFNAYYRGRPMRTLVWKGAGDAPEPFPTPGA